MLRQENEDFVIVSVLSLPVGNGFACACFSDGGYLILLKKKIIEFQWLGSKHFKSCVNTSVNYFH